MASRSVQVFNSKYLYTVQPSTVGTFHSQQKFQFEISEILRAKWNRSLQKQIPKNCLHSCCTDLTQANARLVFVLVSRIQKSSTGDINFVKWKGTFRFNHLKWPDQSKWTTFKVGPVCSGRTKLKWFIPYDVPTEISGILGWMEGALCFHFYPLWFTLTHVIPKLSNLKGRGGFWKPTIKSKA